MQLYYIWILFFSRIISSLSVSAKTPLIASVLLKQDLNPAPPALDPEVQKGKVKGVALWKKMELKDMPANELTFEKLTNPVEHPHSPGLGWTVSEPHEVDPEPGWDMPSQGRYWEIVATSPFSMDAEGKRVRSYHHNIYNFEAGVIIAMLTKTVGLDVHWSDVVAVNWAQFGGANAEELKVVLQWGIANPSTLALITRFDEGTFRPQDADKSNKMKAMALLSSPNGVGVPYLLGMNQAIFGARTVNEIVVTEKDEVVSMKFHIGPR